MGVEILFFIRPNRFLKPVRSYKKKIATDSGKMDSKKAQAIRSKIPLSNIF